VSAEAGLLFAIAVRTTETEVTDASAWVAVGVSGDGDEGTAVTLGHTVTSNGTTLGVVVAEETVLHVAAEVVVGGITTVVLEVSGGSGNHRAVFDTVAVLCNLLETGVGSRMSPSNVGTRWVGKSGNHHITDFGDAVSRAESIFVAQSGAVSLRFASVPS